MSEPFQPGDALIVVDVQNDFCPGGALGVPEGDRVVPELNRWIERAREAGAAMLFSRDWHPSDHCSFEPQGGPWPVHCVAETPGAQFHPDLTVPDEARLIDKATTTNHEAYSALDDPKTVQVLRELGARRLWIGGLAQDYCVKHTVLDACRAGFETHLIRPATRAVNVNEGDGERALQAMREAGAIIEASSRVGA